MTKTTIQTRLNIRRDTSNNRYTVVLQIVRDRKRSLIFTPYKLLPEEFDFQKGTAVPTSRIRQHRSFIQEVNRYLSLQIREVGHIIDTLEQQEKPYSAKDVTYSFRKRFDNRCVNTFINTLIEELETRGKLGTASTYRTTLMAFEKFTVGRRYNFDELDTPTILRFQKYLLGESLKNNTITFYLGKLRSVYNKAVREGFAHVSKLTGLMGRWQKLEEHPALVCDTGHNVGGISYIVEQLKHQKYDRLHIVMGMVNDKDISGVLSMMPKDAIYYFTRADVKRALPENELQALAQQVGLQGQSYPNVKAAVEAAKQHSSEKDFIFVGGSSFIVADLLKFHV